MVTITWMQECQHAGKIKLKKKFDSKHQPLIVNQATFGNLNQFFFFLALAIVYEIYFIHAKIAINVLVMTTLEIVDPHLLMVKWGSITCVHVADVHNKIRAYKMMQLVQKACQDCLFMLF